MGAVVSTLAKLPIVRELEKAVSSGKAGSAAPVARAVAPEAKALATSTRDERAAASMRRSRRAGRRSLLSGGRLGGGGEGDQTTLGSG